MENANNVSVKILLDNQEYFACNSITCSHAISQGLAIRTAQMNFIVPFSSYIQFAIDMANKQAMLGSVIIDDKLYVQGFLNLKMISTEILQDQAMSISFNINDRFFPLFHSEVIKILFFKNHASLQMLMAGILKELDYLKYSNYPQKRVIATDFIKNALNVKNIKLTQNVVKHAVHEKAITIIDEACSIYKVLLNSNGSDTLYVEKYDSYLEPVYKINLSFNSRTGNPEFSNVSNVRKIGQDNNDASKIVVLNPSINRKKPKVKDKHTSLIVIYEKGLPNIQMVKTINREVTYEGLKNGINQSILGLNASANSYVYQLDGVLYDDNKDFFKPNRSVHVSDEIHLINSKMIIIGSSFSIDATNGIRTTLNVSFQESFDDNVNAKHKLSTLKKR
jgi:hypothetical protein